MIERILIEVFTRLGALLLAKGLEQYTKQKKAEDTVEIVDARLEAVQAAMKEAMTNGAMTPEQRKKLKDAFTGFVRSNTTGGL